MKRVAAIILFICILFMACTDKNDENQSFSYDLTGKVTNLDPQFAQEQGSLIIIYNSFDGLMRLNADGELVEGAASQYKISADGLRYEYTISPDALWSDGSPVTADDFLFAFERIFSSASPSPYITDYLNIVNARKVQSGELPVSSLGIEVLAADKIAFNLSEPNTLFPFMLAKSAAMPCKREFFAEQRGRYGLNASTTLTNGPFKIRSWDSKQVVLIPDEYNASPAKADGLWLTIGASTLRDRFSAGTTDFYLGSDGANFGNGYSISSFYDKTYLLVFNRRIAPYDDIDIRKALISALDRDTIASYIKDGRRVAEGIVPPAAVIGGQSFREIAGQAAFPPLAPDARSLLFDTYSRLAINSLPQTDLLLTEGIDMPIGSYMQLMWQQKLSAYIDLQPVGEQELYLRAISGDFTIAIIPVAGADSSPYGILQTLAGRGGDNLTGADYAGVDEILAPALSASEPEISARGYLAAEELILSRYAVMPIYFTSTNFISAPGVSGAYYLPQNGIVYFRDAVRN